ncbi:P-loop containing nucleoside triphosphate hydrolase protein [Basidiobolus meristosporus CBS 931.73]|uniref:RNA helicase n=1 Tax=Basidiobolus meristosporus CBS 931.73 TaxID=1314790 RepID=A0A1Y1XYA8_9FUNG|nr:P-loop containing nucleoside triphosphate hydrolase protein [Basidiobolus meristosporus CBS 931.73]|eukprot:ORX90635.1 P-loop containing nucleoside triphosphate hydrolase protein [Basidiobolus meristosporus CBS 931.73]
MWEVRDIEPKPTQSPGQSKPKAQGKNNRKPKKQVETAETEWEKVSNFAPPPLPSKGDENVFVAGSKKRKPNKKRKRGAAPQPTSSPEYEDIGVDDLNSLDWSEVSYPEQMLLSDELGGFVCLEEIDGVECDWIGDESSGRMVKFKKAKNAKTGRKGKPATPETPLTMEESGNFIDLDSFIATDKKPSKKANTNKPINVEVIENSDEEAVEEEEEEKEEEDDDDDEEEEEEESQDVEPDFDEGFDISAWEKYGLAESIQKALKKLQFDSPTSIQEKTLPLALEGRDIIGAAETGSGKTFAFGLPIIQYLATNVDKEKEGQTALILTPTRELAIQVTDHLKSISQFCKTRIIPIVGGMSIQKQTRLMHQTPDIIVATPGRLWELCSENDIFAANLKKIKFLVLDEADRMLEPGHFKELNYILNLLSNKPQHAREAADDEESSSDTEEETEQEKQTFIFSATISQDLKVFTRKQKKKMSKRSNDSSMQSLMNRIQFKDPEPCFIDVTSTDIMSSTLMEARIDCVMKDKDVYLYYFLVRYPGRTLVFVNSIDAIRRMLPFLQALGVQAYGLHAQMQQRQRLKNVDRFKSNPKAVLIASDVAARGLDIPLVEQVVHYQLPRSGEIYVHRSGRTARAKKEGISVALVCPEELSLYKKICHVLGKQNGLSEFPVDRTLITSMRQRVALAIKIDEEEHRMNKANHESNWLKKSAEALDIDLDEESQDSEGEMVSKKQDAKAKARIASWRAELKHLLQQPILPHGSSGKYLTSGIIRDLADRLNDTAHNTILPAEKATNAVQDIKDKGLKLKKRKGKGRN